jgi:hypothetical protein
VEVHSDWFATVSVAETPFARAAFERVERLLGVLQPVELDRVRSTAGFGDAHVQLDLRHVSALRRADLVLHCTEDLGGLVNPLGYEEYDRPRRGGPPVEQDALDDLAVALTSTYSILETWWRGRRVRTVVTQTHEGEDLGTSVSGWLLLPPRWLLNRDQLTTRRRTVSYGGHQPRV